MYFTWAIFFRNFYNHYNEQYTIILGGFIMKVVKVIFNIIVVIIIAIIMIATCFLAGCLLLDIIAEHKLSSFDYTCFRLHIMRAFELFFYY